MQNPRGHTPMMGLLERHSLIAILIAVLLEELGIPMPIPTDLLIVFAGVRVAGTTNAFVIWLLLLNVASAAGASGLYLIVRRGGRPLIQRYGRFVHLGARQGDCAARALGGRSWCELTACGAL